MKHYLIESVQANATVRSRKPHRPAVAEACVRTAEDDSVAYHTAVEMAGSLFFFKTDKSSYAYHADDIVDEDAFDEIMFSQNGEFETYRDFYSALEKHQCDEELAPIWKYLAFLVLAEQDEADAMKKTSVGMILGEFAIPLCDAEQNYLDWKAQ